MSKASLDIATQAGLKNFLLANGFKRVTGEYGRVRFTKHKGFKRALDYIRKVWEPAISNSSYYEARKLNDVKISLSEDSWGADVSWSTNAFITEDKTDIYKVTKHHPAWAYVEDFLDMESSRSAEAKKRAVDAYMMDFGYTPESLKAIIVSRTTAGVVHPLYGTD